MKFSQKILLAELTASVHASNTEFKSHKQQLLNEQRRSLFCMAYVETSVC